MHGSGPYCPAAQTTWEATAMTFSPLSLKVLVITFVIAALAGGAVAMTRPKPIDSAVLGSEWQCHEIAFGIMTCALRTPAAGSACQGPVSNPTPLGQYIRPERRCAFLGRHEKSPQEYCHPLRINRR